MNMGNASFYITIIIIAFLLLAIVEYQKGKP